MNFWIHNIFWTFELILENLSSSFYLPEREKWWVLVTVWWKLRHSLLQVHRCQSLQAYFITVITQPIYLDLIPDELSSGPWREVHQPWGWVQLDLEQCTGGQCHQLNGGEEKRNPIIAIAFMKPAQTNIQNCKSSIIQSLQSSEKHTVFHIPGWLTCQGQSYDKHL